MQDGWRLLMDLRGKTIDDLRSELDMIDRTIAALERLGELREGDSPRTSKHRPNGLALVDAR